MVNFFGWPEVGRYQIAEKSFPNNNQITERRNFAMVVKSVIFSKNLQPK